MFCFHWRIRCCKWIVQWLCWWDAWFCLNNWMAVFFSDDCSEVTQSDCEGATWHPDPSFPPSASGHAADEPRCAQGGEMVWKPQWTCSCQHRLLARWQHAEGCHTGEFKYTHTLCTLWSESELAFVSFVKTSGILVQTSISNHHLRHLWHMDLKIFFLMCTRLLHKGHFWCLIQRQNTISHAEDRIVNWESFCPDQNSNL